MNARELQACADRLEKFLMNMLASVGRAERRHHGSQYVQGLLLDPNPPISGERLEFWRRQGEICGEKASFHGLRSAITVRGEARRSPQFVHCEKGRHSAP